MTVLVCAVGEAEAADKPSRAHFARSVPIYSIIETLVGEVCAPGFACLKLASIGLGGVPDCRRFASLLFALLVFLVVLFCCAFVGLSSAVSRLRVCFGGGDESGRELHKKRAKSDIFD